MEENKIMEGGIGSYGPFTFGLIRQLKPKTVLDVWSETSYKKIKDEFNLNTLYLKQTNMNICIATFKV